MSGQQHVISDDTAMVAAGRGSQIASRLICRAHEADRLSLYATMCALVEAERCRPGTAEHVASLPAFNLLDLDLPAALAVARDAIWAPGRGAGRHRGSWAVAGQPVRVIDVNSP